MAGASMVRRLPRIAFASALNYAGWRANGAVPGGEERRCVLPGQGHATCQRACFRPEADIPHFRAPLVTFWRHLHC